MSITEQDIKNLTPEHRVVWKEPGAPREVELGLWVDEEGHLHTDMGLVVRWEDGDVSESALRCIVRIIEPALTPRRGMVIGQADPESRRRRLVHVGGSDYPWLGYAPEVDGVCHWWTDAEARDLIENHGWKVVDDLTKGLAMTDAREALVEAEAIASELEAHANIASRPGQRESLHELAERVRRLSALSDPEVLAGIAGVLRDAEDEWVRRYADAEGAPPTRSELQAAAVVEWLRGERP